MVGGNPAPGTGGILDTRNTIGIPNIDGTDANWGRWRVKFEAYAELARTGACLDVAAEQSSFIRHNGVDDNGHRLVNSCCVAPSCVFAIHGLPTLMRCHHHHLLVSKNGSCLAHHEVRRQSSVSGLTGSSTSHGLGTWRVLKEEHEGKGGNPTSALLRGILTHVPDGK